MIYDNITKRENRILLEDQLCELYVTCDCLEEFLIKVNLTYGKIPWRLLTTFKLFYIRKSKPLWYCGIKFGYYILFLGCLLPFIILCIPLVALMPASELIWCYMFHDFMQSIQTYEDWYNGCHVD